MTPRRMNSWRSFTPASVRRRAGRAGQDRTGVNLQGMGKGLVREMGHIENDAKAHEFLEKLHARVAERPVSRSAIRILAATVMHGPDDAQPVVPPGQDLAGIHN